MARTPLPVPEPAQVVAVQQALIRHTNTARRALRAGDVKGYAAALAEQRVCQSWLDTYVTRRAA